MSKLCRNIEVSEDNEPTFEQVEKYCKRRNFAIVAKAIMSDLPKGIIEVSEDCISRKHLKEQYIQTLLPIANTDIELGINIGIEKMYAFIKNAPSVVPSRAEGEWIIDEPPSTGYGTIYTCPFCGHEEEFEPTNYCPICRAALRGEKE